MGDEVDQELETMRRKQAKHTGDRSQAILVRLDKLKAAVDYDGWQTDAKLAEKRQINRSERTVSAILDTMLRKQQVHDGDRSHPFIRKLDALTPSLSYPGWKDDARRIEWPKANWGDLSFQGVGMREDEVDQELETMRRKQAKHTGDRSQAILVRLDKLKTAVDYDGWQTDAKLAEKRQIDRSERVVSAILDTMLRK